MTRYLPGTGYDPIVITGDGPTGDRWTPANETLVGEIPSDVVVRRVPVVSGRTVDSRWRGRRILGKPWVADLGDPWALDEMIVYPTRLHHAWQRRRMAEVLSTAAAIVMSTDEAVRRLRSIPAFAAKQVVAIPNGFDASDFDGPILRSGRTAFASFRPDTCTPSSGREHRRLLPLRRLLGGSVSGVESLTVLTSM
jgi:hypothetical protein